MLSGDPEGTILWVWVVPGSKRTEVVGRHGDTLKVKVSAPAEGGKANEAMLRLLSDLTDARCELRKGHLHRRKQVLVVGREPSEVAAALGIAG